MRKTDLNDSELADLRQLLLQQRERLNAELRRRAVAAQLLAPADAPAPQPRDCGHADDDLFCVCDQPAREQQALRALDLALQKIDQPQRHAHCGYGHCERCGAAIGYPRLLMHPAALLCLKCQRNAEKPESGHD